MTPVFQIDNPPWRAMSGLRAVMAALAAGDRAEGGDRTEGSGLPVALLVGGSVRNAVLGAPAADIDIATVLTPAAVTARLRAASLRVFPTGIDHGTVTAVVDGNSFEITTLRRDVETDGRRAVVAFSTDWAEDARRRDFTMNTLLADGEGRVYDPAGRGLADLRAGRVVFVGDPAQRIAEDYLRILRFFRFHAAYGKGAPDPAALAACRAAAGGLSTLSRERITHEIWRTLSVDDPVDVLDIMFDNNILPDIASSGYQGGVLSALCTAQRRAEAVDVVARLLVLAGFEAAHRSILERFLILPGRDWRRFDDLAAAAPALTGLSEKSVRLLVYKYKKDFSIQVVLIYAARHGVEGDEAVRQIRAAEIPVLPVDGEDIMRAGVAPGPAVGSALRAVESWWIENDFRPGREECLRHLGALSE